MEFHQKVELRSLPWSLSISKAVWPLLDVPGGTSLESWSVLSVRAVSSRCNHSPISSSTCQTGIANYRSVRKSGADFLFAGQFSSIADRSLDCVSNVWAFSKERAGLAGGFADYDSIPEHQHSVLC